MSHYPDGTSQNDLDRAAGGYDPPDCLRCQQTPCECCARCGASPEQACEKWCGGQSMNWEIKCATCGTVIWIRGHVEDDTNALVLSDTDSRWEDGCEHIKKGDYLIGDAEIEHEEW